MNIQGQWSCSHVSYCYLEHYAYITLDLISLKLMKGDCLQSKNLCWSRETIIQKWDNQHEGNGWDGRILISRKKNYLSSENFPSEIL